MAEDQFAGTGILPEARSRIQLMMKFFIAAIACLPALCLTAQTTGPNDFQKYDQKVPGTQISFTMVPVQAGSFMMGSPENDKQKESDETPQHKVEISAFWMGATELTHDAFSPFFNDAELEQGGSVDAVTRPTVPYIDLTLGKGREGGFPVVSVKPFTAMMYCKWLYSKTGIFYRLPTEAEWEYASRAGSTTIYPFGDAATQLGDYAWYKPNSNDAFHKVGLKKPNAWGLYDMLGNVSEWVIDQYQADFYGKVAKDAKDPVRMPEVKHPGTLRGGSYVDDADALRAANRIPSRLDWNRRDPQIPKSRWWNADAPFTGFRIVRPLKQPTPEEAKKYYDTYLGI